MTDALAEYSSYIFGGFPENEVIAVPDENGHPSVMAFIFDAEYDPFAMKFDCDGIVSLETKGYQWVMLDAASLRDIANMCAKAKGLWRKINKFYDGDNDEWGAWHHLATIPQIVTPDTEAK